MPNESLKLARERNHTTSMMIKYPKCLTLTSYKFSMVLMGIQLLFVEWAVAKPVPITRPPFNCFTREVWSPAKRAWCEQFGPQTEESDWPEFSRPGTMDIESDRNRYTTLALETLPTHTSLKGSDPKAIALSLVDLPETEGDSQKRTSVSIRKGQSAVVMLSQVGLADDSVQGIRYRLEFEPLGIRDGEEEWQLVWMGRQQLCWPGRGPEEWTKKTCL